MHYYVGWGLLVHWHTRMEKWNIQGIAKFN